ncbi:MAG: hypothetical protein HS118_07060 [Bacteroidia bacterium]|nr:hypothetical protein [Bacteroidia bacterium]MBE7509937.1 hypothetical protein [Bacteroidia bacterium]
MCIDKGMVGASRQAVDSAYIKANASMDSIVESKYWMMPKPIHNNFRLTMKQLPL